MHLRLAPETRRALEGRVELFFLDGSYVGLELIENGIANLCFVLPRVTVARLGSGWPALRGHLASALPSLAERLAGAEPLWDKPLAVVCPTGGYLHREQGTAVYRVGDRLAHIPPFTGATASPSRSRQRRWRSGIFGAAARPTPILQRRDNSRPVPSGWRASSRALPGAAEDAI
jgi:hypothetical protein